MAANAASSIGKSPPKLKPPISIEASLHLAWGLTMNLSDDTKQTTFAAIVNKIWENLPSSLAKDEPEVAEYIHEFIGITSSYIRSMASKETSTQGI